MLAAKVDANQPDIVADLRKVGCQVLSLARLGKGCPDILVRSPSGGLYLFEIKTPEGELNPKQREFYFLWWGNVNVIRNTEDALTMMGLTLDSDGNRRDCRHL